MNKDDEELFRAFRKRIYLPMIIDPNPPSPETMAGIVAATFRAEKLWETFYPVNQNKILIPFLVEGNYYSLEISYDAYENEENDINFVRKIKKEIKEIISGSEKFYFVKMTNKDSKDKELEKLRLAIEKENPKLKSLSLTTSFKGVNYLIVGKDRAHLCRTIIYIANKK